MLSKDFPGGVLVMTGANSAVGLRSMPARYLFMDEIDGYPQDIDGEGDPILLAERRTATFNKRKKIFLVSTPTIKGLSNIEREFENSDKRYFLCPVLSVALISGWNGNRYRRKTAMCSMRASIAVDISVNITNPDAGQRPLAGNCIQRWCDGGFPICLPCIHRLGGCRGKNAWPFMRKPRKIQA